MREQGVLTPILPELINVARLRGLQGLDAKEAHDPVLRLAALLAADGGKTAEKLRLSNNDRARLELLTASLPVWPARDERALRRALHRLGAERVRDLALLAWAEGDAALGCSAFEAAAGWAPLASPVRGQDALDLGVPPGPKVGQLIAAVEAWWEEGDYRADRAACLAKLKELAAVR
jgi:poly(A) polymerase